jgi:hypothetical protein
MGGVYLSEEMISAALIWTTWDWLGWIHTSGFSCLQLNDKENAMLKSILKVYLKLITFEI